MRVDGPHPNLSSNVATPSFSPMVSRSALAPSLAPVEAGSIQGQKALRGLSASQPALQAKKLALQIKELQLQQQDLLRVSAPFSPGGPPRVPLPPIPRLPLYQQHSDREGVYGINDGTSQNGRTVPPVGVTNSVRPPTPVPSANHAKGGNHGGRSSHFSGGLARHADHSNSTFAQQQDGQICHVNGSNKATNASSVSLLSENGIAHGITEEGEDEEDGHLTILANIPRHRVTRSGSWKSKMSAEFSGEHANYTPAGLQSPRYGISASNHSSSDGNKPTTNSKDTFGSGSDTKTKNNLNQAPNTTRDLLFPFSGPLDTSSKVPATISSLSSSSDGGDYVEGDGVLVEKSDLEGTLSTNEDHMDSSISRSGVLSGQRDLPSHHMPRASRQATAAVTGLLTRSTSRRTSWPNGPSPAMGHGAGTNNVGDGRAASLARGDKLGDPMPENLPDWSEVEGGGPTSLPIHDVQRKLDFALRRLLTIQVFEESKCWDEWSLFYHADPKGTDHVRVGIYAVLEDPLGRHRFRDYLVSIGASTAELDLWLDLQHHAALYQSVLTNAEALHGNDSLFLAFDGALTLLNPLNC